MDNAKKIPHTVENQIYRLKIYQSAHCHITKKANNILQRKTGSFEWISNSCLTIYNR